MQIKLSNDMTTEIDISDYWKIAGHSWYAVERRHTWYAETMIDNRTVGMHTVIRPPPAGLITDHKDHNGLNNRYDNLRHATYAENAYNRINYTSVSGYKGVSLTTNGGYQARITQEGRTISLGTYETAEEAARAYDDAARRFRGPFASLNFED